MCSSNGTGAASSATQDAILSRVQISVAKKQLDAAKAQGEAIVELLAVVASSTKAIGRGEGFDASA